MQGVWKIESFDRGEEIPPGEREGLKEDRLQFEGDVLSIVESRSRHVDVYKFSLDWKSDPKVMQLTHTKDREKSEWLYKFEGDTLVLAMFESGEPRPTEFVARPMSRAADKPRDMGVIIVRLRKTDEVPAGREPKRPNLPTYRMTTGK